jgi:hypothetical protein
MIKCLCSTADKPDQRHRSSDRKSRRTAWTTLVTLAILFIATSRLATVPGTRILSWHFASSLYIPDLPNHYNHDLGDALTHATSQALVKILHSTEKSVM